MQVNNHHHTDAHRRPAALDLLAAVLLAGTVVLHVVAMFFTYYKGSPTLSAQADEASLYAVLAAAWALALVFGLTGPHRTPIAAGLGGGVALGEIGFRVSDVGDAIHYGTRTVGIGVWLMTIAWAVGAVGALVAWLAAHRRHRARPAADAEPVDAATAEATAGATSGAASAGATPASVAANPYDPDSTTEFVPDKTAETPIAGVRTDTEVIPAVPDLAVASAAQQRNHERLVWTILVVVLAGLTAGAFLPAWDHGVAVSSVEGRTVFSKNLGNAFSGPWLQVLGNVIAAGVFLVVPIVAIRLKNKAVGAALVCGVLLVLAAQFTSAVVQASQAVPPYQLGFSSSQVQQYGLSLSIQLTGWFTVNALAAYALFAVVMVWANLRTVEAREPVPSQATQSGTGSPQAVQAWPPPAPWQPGPAPSGQSIPWVPGPAPSGQSPAGPPAAAPPQSWQPAPSGSPQSWQAGPPPAAPHPGPHPGQGWPPPAPWPHSAQPPQ